MITDEIRKIVCAGNDCHYDREFICTTAKMYTDVKAYPPERLAMAQMHGFGMRLSYLLFADDKSYAGMKKLDATFSEPVTAETAEPLIRYIMKDDYTGDQLPAITAAIAVITARENPPDLNTYNRAFVRNWCTYCSRKD